MNELRFVLLVWTTCLMMGLCRPVVAADQAIGLPDVRRSYVTFEAVGVDHPWSVAGELRVPQREQDKFPAVIIVHGSNGVDSRGQYHAASLNDRGIITLEIDMWAARKNFSGAGKRPKGVPETLPDAYGALAYLAGLSFVDADRIGIMGFSWGGVVSMLTATKPYDDKLAPADLNFAAHVAFYPVCWGYNVVPGYEFREFTGAPVLILAGELDDYDAFDSAPKLIAELPEAAKKFISCHVYPDATHGWNMQGNIDATINDPFAHRGRGGEVRFVSNPAVAEQSRDRTDAFFCQAFGLND